LHAWIVTHNPLDYKCCRFVLYSKCHFLNYPLEFDGKLKLTAQTTLFNGMRTRNNGSTTFRKRK